MCETGLEIGFSQSVFKVHQEKKLKIPGTGDKYTYSIVRGSKQGSDVNLNGPTCRIGVRGHSRWERSGRLWTICSHRTLTCWDFLVLMGCFEDFISVKYCADITNTWRSNQTTVIQSCWHLPWSSVGLAPLESLWLLLFLSLIVCFRHQEREGSQAPPSWISLSTLHSSEGIRHAVTWSE